MSYEIRLDGFSIDFFLDSETSLNLTQGFGALVRAEKFFAAGEIWIKAGHTSFRLIKQTQAGNLFVVLDEIQRRIKKPGFPTPLPQFVLPGDCAKWMFGYWKRVQQDLSTAEDETHYDQLYPLCVAVESEGYLFVYWSNECLFVEAASIDAEGNPADVASACDPEKLFAQIDDIRSGMEQGLRKQKGPGSN